MSARQSPVSFPGQPNQQYEVSVGKVENDCSEKGRSRTTNKSRRGNLDEGSRKVQRAGTSKGREVNQQCTTDFTQDNPILPFAKRHPAFWKLVESMQVFSLFPQNPHFRTLLKKEEFAREGLAIGLMINFVNTVERICTWQPDGPKKIIEDFIKDLTEFEDNGFDVHVVRDRLMQLLLIKNKLEGLEAKAKEVNDQIKEEKLEDLDNHIRLLREQLDLALSAKTQKDSLVAHLK